MKAHKHEHVYNKKQRREDLITGAVKDMPAFARESMKQVVTGLCDIDLPYVLTICTEDNTLAISAFSSEADVERAIGQEEVDKEAMQEVYTTSLENAFEMLSTSVETIVSFCQERMTHAQGPDQTVQDICIMLTHVFEEMKNETGFVGMFMQNSMMDMLMKAQEGYNPNTPKTPLS